MEMMGGVYAGSQVQKAGGYRYYKHILVGL